MTDTIQALIIYALVVPIAFGIVTYIFTTIGIRRGKIRSTGRLRFGRAMGAVVKEADK